MPNEYNETMRELGGLVMGEASDGADKSERKRFKRMQEAFVEGRAGRTTGASLDVEQRYDGRPSEPERYDDGRLVRPWAARPGSLAERVRAGQRSETGEVLLRERGPIPPHMLRTEDGKMVDDRGMPGPKFTAEDFAGLSKKQIKKLFKRAKKAEEAADPLCELAGLVMGDGERNDARRRAFREGRAAA